MGKKRLNQIVAIERDVKAKGYKDVTKEFHLLQKPEVVNGMQKTYSPKDEDGEKFPAESKNVQVKVKDALREIHDRNRELFDLVLTKDTGNQTARADVVVDGTVVIKDVPVPTLLFLEKQLEDMHTIVSKLPVLDPAEQWKLDEAQGLYVTPPIETVKTKKQKKAIVMYPHSAEHPAQTQLIDDDIIVGTWTMIKHSGAIPNDKRQALVRKVETLQKAVKQAREEANMAEVAELRMGDTVFSYLFADATA